jgi:cytochrome c553
MAPLVASLSETDIADLAAWYASQAPAAAAADPELAEAGKHLYQAGNPETGVPACMACHGPAGEGNPLAGYPALAGQHSVYIENALTRFRSGQTWGEDDNASLVMAGVAAELSDAEIKAVASAIQGWYKVP